MNDGLIWPGPNSDLWETPPEIFEPLDREFRFTVDVCAYRETAKVGRFFYPEQDGLKQDWSGHTVWCNPPYSKGQISQWVDKAASECATVVMLLPAFTDQKWFHRSVNPLVSELRFFEGRIKFLLDGKRQGSPRFASMLAIWRST